MKTMKKYATGGAKPAAKTAAQLKKEGEALKAKGQAMKAAGKAQASYKQAPTGYGAYNKLGNNTKVALNPKNKTYTTTNYKNVGNKQVAQTKVDKLTPKATSYKEGATGYGAYKKPGNSTKVAVNPKNKTVTTVNYKNVGNKQYAQTKVTKYGTAKPAAKAPVKTPVKTPVKPPVKTPVKTPVAKAPVKAKAEEMTFEPMEIRKAEPIQIAKKELVQPAKVEEKKNIAEKIKEKLSDAKTERRERRLERLKDKLGEAKRGGSVKKYQNGGMTGAQMKAKGMAMKTKGTAMKIAGSAQKAKGAAMARANADKNIKRLSTAGSGTSAFNYGNSDRVYKTGGMVNSNSKVSALKSAGSKGVKSGVNSKVTASKVARGRVGGTSTAPKKAVPSMKKGW